VSALGASTEPVRASRAGDRKIRTVDRTSRSTENNSSRSGETRGGGAAPPTATCQRVDARTTETNGNSPVVTRSAVASWTDRHRPRPHSDELHGCVMATQDSTARRPRSKRRRGKGVDEIAEVTAVGPENQRASGAGGTPRLRFPVFAAVNATSRSKPRRRSPMCRFADAPSPHRVARTNAAAGRTLSGKAS